MRAEPPSARTVPISFMASTETTTSPLGIAPAVRDDRAACGRIVIPLPDVAARNTAISAPSVGRNSPAARPGALPEASSR